MIKLLVAAVLGGLVAFGTAGALRMATPLGHQGLEILPDEAAVVERLQTSVPESGLYLFPTWGSLDEPTPEQEEAWAARLKAGPRGLLLFQREGDEPMSARQLGTELASNVLAALILALVLRGFGGIYLGRVLLSGALGLFAGIAISVSHWNWYGFPLDFTWAECAMEAITWLAAGLVIAPLARKPERT